MKRYFHKTLNGYFIERNGTFYMNTGDGVEMELAYRPPVERMLADGVLVEQPTTFTSVLVEDICNDTAEVLVPDRLFGGVYAVNIMAEDMLFTPAQARELANALNDAADFAECKNAN